MLRSTISILALLSAAALAAGCSDDGEADAAGGQGGQGGYGGEHHEGGADCDAIATICHDVDGLTDQAHECHEVSHAGDAHECAEYRADCVAYCTELAGGGAGGGGAHSH